MSDQTQAVILAEPEKAIRSWQPMSGGDLLKYSAASFQKYFMPPTKKGIKPSQIDGEKALMFCMAGRFDPRKNEVFFVPYDSDAGPQWAPVVSYFAYCSRAAAAKGYSGMSYGVTVSRKKDGADVLEDIEGEIVPRGAELVGGWCRVTVADRLPTYARLGLNRYGKGTKFWVDNPEGMITKCAIAAAHRKAFPDTLGSLFISEELPERNITPIADAEPQQRIDAPMAVEPATGDAGPFPVDALVSIVTRAGYSFDDFKAFCAQEGYKEADNAGCFGELTMKFAKRMVAAKAGLLAGLAQMKEANV